MAKSSNQTTIDDLMRAPIVARTKEVVGAFAGEDVTLDKVADMPFDLLQQVGTLDAVTFAVLLAIPHLRDVADVNDISQDLPEEVLAALVRVKTDFIGTGGEFIDHILCDSNAAAKIRLAQHIADMADKAKSIVTESDQEGYFVTCVLAGELAKQIAERGKVDQLSEGLMRRYSVELRRHAAEMKTLDADLFTDLAGSIESIRDSRASLVAAIFKSATDRKSQTKEAAEQAEFRANNPFPHPKSPFMRNKGKVRVVFRP